MTKDEERLNHKFKENKEEKKKQFLPPGKKPRIYKKANETIICEYSAQQTQNFTQSWI